MRLKLNESQEQVHKIKSGGELPTEQYYNSRNKDTAAGSGGLPIF